MSGAAFNLIGNIAPLIFGIVTVPFIIHRIGSDAFGILALGWALLGAAGLLDLGLGRAATKFVAEDLRDRRDESIGALVGTALTISGAMGIVIGAVLALGSGFLVAAVESLGGPLAREARTTFLVLALALPFLTVSGTLRGVLEAASRFDLVNAVRVPLSSALFVVPAMAVAFGVNLPGIALLLVIATAAASSAYLMLCRQAFPDVRLRAGFEKMAARRLVAYGKWVTVSNLLAPLLVYADRFLIAAFVSASAVTYYVAPYEVATRLWVIPASLVAVLFPRFAVFTDPDIASVRRVFVQAIKYLLLFMIPLVAVLTAGAVPLLRAWLGESFARESSLGLQILAVGVLINSIGQVPFALIQGLGRPDVVAKLYLAEVGFYLVLASLLIQRYGIPGAAAAWTIRAAVDAFLLLAVAFKLSPIGWHSLLEHGMPRVLAGNAAILAICAVVPAAVSRAETPVGALAAGVFAGLLAVAIWLAMFNRNDRERFRQLAVDSFRRREIA